MVFPKVGSLFQRYSFLDLLSYKFKELGQTNLPGDIDSIVVARFGNQEGAKKDD